jgi:hypothetical protein
MLLDTLKGHLEAVMAVLRVARMQKLLTELVVNQSALGDQKDFFVYCSLLISCRLL